MFWKSIQRKPIFWKEINTEFYITDVIFTTTVVMDLDLNFKVQKTIPWLFFEMWWQFTWVLLLACVNTLNFKWGRLNGQWSIGHLRLESAISCSPAARESTPLPCWEQLSAKKNQALFNKLNIRHPCETPHKCISLWSKFEENFNSNLPKEIWHGKIDCWNVLVKDFNARWNCFETKLKMLRNF